MPTPNTILGDESEAARLWSGLSEDLKHPAISQLKPSSKGEEDQYSTCDLNLATTALFIPASVSTAPAQLELYPDPKHVFKLWQTFVDYVNPLTKIVHAPTLQQKIFETAWTAESTPKPLEATIFAVYALAVASMSTAECLQSFGQSKSVLLGRYRMGALRALASCDLLSTRNLEVLQALALVLMIDPQSELSTTAVALAMRISHKMGLHRAVEGSQETFFELEMKVRLWWFIRGLNSRSRRAMGLLSTIDDLAETRLPMNVNDADLHPSMSSPPTVQHAAGTEMVYVLVKYDLWTFVRKSSNFSGSLNPREKATQLTESTSVDSLTKKRKVLSEVEQMLKQKYLDHLDPNILLQRLAIFLAGTTIHRQRFLMFHPRHQPEGGRHMSQADQDAVFESSVKLLELDRHVRSMRFSIALVDNMTCRTQVEALVYMVSELRRRTSGPLVETAWILLGQMHDEEPNLMQGNHKFYAALADLTLEAWEARWQALEQRPEAVPNFIEMLLMARAEAGKADEPAAGSGGLPSEFMDDLLRDEPLDWNYA